MHPGPRPRNPPHSRPLPAPRRHHRLPREPGLCLPQRGRLREGRLLQKALVGPIRQRHHQRGRRAVARAAQGGAAVPERQEPEGADGRGAAAVPGGSEGDAGGQGGGRAGRGLAGLGA